MAWRKCLLAAPKIYEPPFQKSPKIALRFTSADIDFRGKTELQPKFNKIFAIDTKRPILCKK